MKIEDSREFENPRRRIEADLREMRLLKAQNAGCAFCGSSARGGGFKRINGPMVPLCPLHKEIEQTKWQVKHEKEFGPHGPHAKRRK